MVMKSMKSKIAAGVIVTGLVAGMGTAFAATDAGAQLNSWYKSAVGAVLAQTGKEAASETAQKIADNANGTYKTLKQDSVASVDANEKSESEEAMSEINAQKNIYNDQVNGAANALVGGDIASDFSKFENGAEKVVDGTIFVTKLAGQFDLKGTINKQGKSSLDQINKNVAAYKKSSTENLSATISTAKTNVTNEINTQNEKTQAELSAYVDGKIADMNDELAGYANGLVTTNNNKVTAAGEAGTEEALAALDAIVDSIN